MVETDASNPEARLLLNDLLREKITEMFIKYPLALITVSNNWGYYHGLVSTSAYLITFLLT
jgi:hypothetical protein